MFMLYFWEFACGYTTNRFDVPQSFRVFDEFVVFVITLFFGAMVLVSLLRSLTGNDLLAYGLVALLFAAIGVLLYVMRKPWIETPLTNYIANELLKDEDENL